MFPTDVCSTEKVAEELQLLPPAQIISPILDSERTDLADGEERNHVELAADCSISAAAINDNAVPVDVEQPLAVSIETNETSVRENDSGATVELGALATDTKEM